jgi:hypothetical protein
MTGKVTAGGMPTPAGTTADGVAAVGDGTDVAAAGGDGDTATAPSPAVGAGDVVAGAMGSGGDTPEDARFRLATMAGAEALLDDVADSMGWADFMRHLWGQ